MKIAVVDNLPVGGAKRVVFEQIKYLSQKHTIDYYSNEFINSFPFSQVCGRIFQYRFNQIVKHGYFRFLTELDWLTRGAKTYWEVASKINQSDAQLILVHPCSLTQAPMLIPWLTKPVVYFAEEWFRLEYEPSLQPWSEIRGYKKWYERLRREIAARIDRVGVSRSSKIITTSEFNLKHIQNAYQKSAEVLPLGVDTAVFKPAASKEKKYFLFVGSRNHLDGYDLLQEARSLAPANLVVKDVGCSGNHFALDDQELAKMYQGAVATLCLAHQEPFGLVALESMACGTPVIAVNEGGYRETVVNNLTGVLIEREPEKLYLAMKLFSQDAKLRLNLGKNGHNRVQRLYTWESHGGKLEKLLEEIVYA